MNKNKFKLINLIVERAIATLDDSEFLIENKKYNIAVNRLYYSIYYSLTALAEIYNFETSKHSQLIGWFNKTFIITDKIDRKYGKIVHNLFDYRIKADYDIYSNFNKIQIDDMFMQTKSFITVIIDFVQKELQKITS